MTNGPGAGPLGTRVEARLQTAWLGRPLVGCGRVPSTMDVARALAEDAPRRGRVVLADEQSRGRGRSGRPFVSPPGGVYLTAELDPLDPPGETWRLGLCATLAIREAVSDLGGPALALSWPNDLFDARTKVAGVLVELVTVPAGGRRALVGVGVNVSPAAGALAVPDAGPAGPLPALASDDPSADVVARTLAALERLDGRVRAPGGWPDVLESVRRAAQPFVGARQTVLLPGGARARGTVEGVADDGALLLRAPGGRVEAIRLGEIERA